ncbi:DUF58 domain-containing protein [Methanothermococcus sp. SCGC AD-155-C09]|nr:DUF58 domain-containing protein [Methanothermococcus sp. SCGC AD-155-C09]
MDRATAYLTILSRFGVISFACGYLLNNLYITFLGIFIFLYIYYIENIANLKIDVELEDITLKERNYSKIIVNVHKKDNIPSLNFSSPHGILSYNLLKKLNNGDILQYLINTIPHKKGEFILNITGKVYDLRELISIEYNKSFKLYVEPSIEGLKYNIGKESQMALLSKGIIEPEIDELKHYEIGEDFKRIDWKKSFTVGRLIVRKLTHLEDRVIYCLLDIGSSMRKSTREDRNKINYATTLLLNIIKGNKGNDLNVIIYDDYRILKTHLIKGVNRKYLSKNTLKGGEIVNDLLSIKPIMLEKYIPNVENIYRSNSTYNKEDTEDSCILHSYLSKKGRGSFGIFECAKLLIKMKIGTVVIFTDLESNIIPLFKSINILIRRGFKVIIYALYTPSFNLDKKELFNEDLSIKLYKHYENRTKIIRDLKKRGVIVVDVAHKDNINDIINKMKNR